MVAVVRIYCWASLNSAVLGGNVSVWMLACEKTGEAIENIMTFSWIVVTYIGKQCLLLAIHLGTRCYESNAYILVHFFEKLS